MGLLQYTSNEMFSSTELVRKNKSIFDKLNKNEIQKAIILRDGKPGIILMDFNFYEKIMAEYLELKELNSNTPKIKKDPISTEKINKSQEISNDEFQNALDEIDKLDFNFDSTKTNNERVEPLKEFWD